MQAEAPGAPAALEHALAYAALGWPVLPIKPGEKIPAGGQGIDHASTDPEVIHKWFSRFPAAGVAIRLDRAGLCAIDIDPRNGATKTPESFPTTLTARTGGGGWHLLYRVPAGVALVGRLEPGIDLKWRGYIIVEPSLHPSGGAYTWQDWCYLLGPPEIADLPLEILEKRIVAPVPGANDEGAIAEGGRNDFLSRQAYSFRKAGMGVDAIEAALLALNDAACSPPLDAAEVKTIAQGKRKVEPGQWQDPADDFEVLGSPVDRRFYAHDEADFRKGKKMDWIVKDVLPRAEIAMIYGESGSGKSFFALDLVAAIARGVEWNGKQVQQGRVIYIAAEGAGGFRNRLKAYAIHHKIDRIGNLGIIPDAPNFMRPNDIKDLITSIKVFGQVDVIVVDTLAAVTPGANENSGEDMGKVLGHCKEISRATGALVILIHHQGKDASKGARGWSGVNAGIDAEIKIERADRNRMATVSKLKEGDDGLSFGFQLLQVNVEEDDEGDMVTSCIPEYAAAPARGARRQTGPKGANEKLVWQAVIDLQGVGGDRPTTAEVIDESVSKMLHDSSSGRRDRRREIALRALTTLVERGVAEKDGEHILLKTAG